MTSTPAGSPPNAPAGAGARVPSFAVERGDPVDGPGPVDRPWREDPEVRALFAAGGPVGALSGLAPEDVSVVLVAGQPIVVGLTRDAALSAGFTVVDADPELLRQVGIGVLPPQPPVAGIPIATRPDAVAEVREIGGGSGIDDSNIDDSDIDDSDIDDSEIVDFTDDWLLGVEPEPPAVPDVLVQRESPAADHLAAIRAVLSQASAAPRNEVIDRAAPVSVADTVVPTLDYEDEEEDQESDDAFPAFDGDWLDSLPDLDLPDAPAVTLPVDDEPVVGDAVADDAVADDAVADDAVADDAVADDAVADDAVADDAVVVVVPVVEGPPEADPAWQFELPPPLPDLPSRAPTPAWGPWVERPEVPSYSLADTDHESVIYDEDDDMIDVVAQHDAVQHDAVQHDAAADDDADDDDPGFAGHAGFAASPEAPDAVIPAPPLPARRVETRPSGRTVSWDVPRPRPQESVFEPVAPVDAAQVWVPADIAFPEAELPEPFVSSFTEAFPAPRVADPDTAAEPAPAVDQWPLTSIFPDSGISTINGAEPAWLDDTDSWNAPVRPVARTPLADVDEPRRRSTDVAIAAPAVVVAAHAVTKTYRSGNLETVALRGVDLEVHAGEFVVVMGPSGSGKSTLLNCLSGLDEIDSGAVLLENERIHDLNDADRARHRAVAMGFIFQSFNLIPVFTAAENVELPLLLNGWTARAARREAVGLLERVGLGHRVKQKPGALSGGEQQRVAIARALVGGPRIVWADEPTGSLDAETADGVLELLRELNGEGLTLLLVTHDEAIGASAPRRVVVRDGRIVSDELRVP